MENVEEDGPRGPWEQKWFRASLVFLVVVCVAATVIVVSSLLSSSGQDDTRLLEGTEVSQAIEPSESVCGLGGGDQSVPTVEAPATSWELVGRMAAPSDPKIGPGIVNEGLRSCFSRSPVGALFATANFYVQGSSSELAFRNAELNIASGVGRDRILARLKGKRAAVGSADVSVQIAGFKIFSYTGESATVDIVVRGTNGANLSAVTQLVWERNDWKIVVQDNGQPAIPQKSLPSVGDYIPWSGA